MNPTILSIIESPTHPKLSGLFKQIGAREIKVNSCRNAIKALKTCKPDFIIAEFFYGYGNNYAGVNVSNLDVLLSSLPKYSPDTRAIIFVMKEEVPYISKLSNLYPIYAAFTHGTPEYAIEHALLNSAEDD
ncbi:hypothetical protein MNBD_GAMMA11-1776 [hydrothermal vent metagenome]|uniref:Response regulatory domain-containing protein n=1 Tax=hydrothermal vent metagenome TaxID=652676 RepID=A0A3B0XRB5_9ZZZZ